MLEHFCAYNVVIILGEYTFTIIFSFCFAYLVEGRDSQSGPDSFSVLTQVRLVSEFSSPLVTVVQDCRPNLTFLHEKLVYVAHCIYDDWNEFVAWNSSPSSHRRSFELIQTDKTVILFCSISRQLWTCTTRSRSWFLGGLLHCNQNSFGWSKGVVDVAWHQLHWSDLSFWISTFPESEWVLNQMI